MLSKRNANYERAFDRSKEFGYKLKTDQSGEYRFEYVSDSFSKITGITADEAVTMKMEDLVHKEDQKKVTDHLETVMEGKPNTEQFRIQSIDGGYAEVIDYAKPEWDADHTNVVAIKGAVSTEISSEHKA